MVTASYTTTGQGPFSGAETFGDDYYEEAKTEVVMDYLAGALPVEHPRHSDRMYRLFEIARIVLHDFELPWNDAYDVMVAFNLGRVKPLFEDIALKSILNAAVDHWTDKQPGWRLYDDPDLLGEYDITSHSYILPLNNPSITAKAFLRFRCSVQCMPKVRLFQGKYWAWDGSRYVKIEKAEIQRRLEEFLEMALAYSDKGFETFPTQPKVLDAIMESVQRIILLPDDIQLPSYLGAGAPPEAPETLIFGHTKTLRLSDRAVFDSQPYWFSSATRMPHPLANKGLSSVCPRPRHVAKVTCYFGFVKFYK